MKKVLSIAGMMLAGSLLLTGCSNTTASPTDGGKKTSEVGTKKLSETDQKKAVLTAVADYEKAMKQFAEDNADNVDAVKSEMETIMTNDIFTSEDLDAPAKDADKLRAQIEKLNPSAKFVYLNDNPTLNELGTWMFVTLVPSAAMAERGTMELTDLSDSVVELNGDTAKFYPTSTEGETSIPMILVNGQWMVDVIAASQEVAAETSAQ